MALRSIFGGITFFHFGFKLMIFTVIVIHFVKLRYILQPMSTDKMVAGMVILGHQNLTKSFIIQSNNHIQYKNTITS